jgi:pre-mRNA cleavage complex 2 protein Pcf11
MNILWGKGGVPIVFNQQSIIMDDEEEIDDEQVEDYCSMLDKLGNIPEKMKINSLSMAAEDFASSLKSATTIYKCIVSRLIDTTTGSITSSADRKLPLVYVLDSLLKNVGGVYIDIIQNDAPNWMRIVYDIFDRNKKEDEKARLKKVWNTWKEFGVIKDIDKWRNIGQCFLEAEEKAKAAAAVIAASTISSSSGAVVVFERNADGTLKIPISLRRQMQLLLDEVQSTGVDELDKVSLERLADINPNLLQQIKDAAMEEQKQHQQHQQHQQQSSSSSTLSGRGIKSSLVSAIPPTSSSSSSSDWSKLNLNHLEKSSSLIASLQRHVRSANGITIVSSQVDDTVHLYASVSASAQILTTMLQQFKDGTNNLLLHMDDEEDDDNNKQSKRKRRYSIVKKENFTNDGVRKRNDAVIAQLYEVGLPFICSTDGRRFASQIELSKHLDTLFRISQVEKNIERTGGGIGGIGGSSNERGWYMNEDDWSLLGKTMDDAIMTMGNTTDKASSTPLPGSGTMSTTTMNDDGTTRPNTVIADESRDRCSLCGINFAMFFDQDDGEWKYRNCMESNVENDGPTMEEEDCDPVLVHVTCWEGLGCPTVLGLDEIRHST